MSPITNKISTPSSSGSHSSQSGSHSSQRLSSGLRLSRPLVSGLLGIALLLPATYFGITLILRICFGTATLYRSMAPSFLQSPFFPFAWHKAQFIIGTVLLAILFNLLTVLRFRLQKGQKGWEVAITWRRYWLNTAITLQSTLLFLALVAYTLIQHIRY